MPSLTTDERTQIVDTFVELIEGLYTHLPLKRAMYAIDPLQRLRLLRQRISTIDDWELHSELAATMTGLRDAHTRYIGPTALADQAATLPFLVEAYGDPSERRYIVSKVTLAPSRIRDPHFVAGVELLRWNAVPMDRAVDIHADRETGGRPDSTPGRALESLTFRALQYVAPPDEDWVIVAYRDLRGKSAKCASTGGSSHRAARTLRDGRNARRRAAFAIDPEAETTRRVKKLLFAPKLWYADRSRASGFGASRAGEQRNPQSVNGSTMSSRTWSPPRSSRRRRELSVTCGSGASMWPTTSPSSTKWLGSSRCSRNVG